MLKTDSSCCWMCWAHPSYKPIWSSSWSSLSAMPEGLLEDARRRKLATSWPTSGSRMLHERFKPRLDLRRDLTQALYHERQGENSRPEKKSPSPQGSMVESGLHRHADLLFWVAHVYF